MKPPTFNPSDLSWYIHDPDPYERRLREFRYKWEKPKTRVNKRSYGCDSKETVYKKQRK